MLASALVLCALAQEASGYVFTVPDKWTRHDERSGTILLPPGATPAEATLMLYPVTPNAEGTPQDVHDKMVAAFSKTGTVRGGKQTGSTGLFTWTRLTLETPGNAPMRLAIYTAKSGTDAGVVAFAAAEALFGKHLQAVESLVKELRFAGAAAVHGLVLPFPAGWTRRDDPQGAVVFTPPPPKSALEPAWDYVLVVLPTQPLRGTHWETHRALFKEVVQASQLADPTDPIHRVDAPGPFVRSEAAGRDAQGAVRVVSMYSARSENGVECVVIRNQEDRDGLRPILAQATLKAPRKTERPKVVEAYRRVDVRFVDSGSVQYERLWLRSDGVADFHTIYPRGAAVAPETQKYDAGLLNGDVGAWTAKGGTIEVRRSEGAAPWVFEREGRRLKQGGKLWQPMPAVDGLRLDGRWGREDATIAFGMDGRFADEGAAMHVATGDGDPAKPPRRGAGTYEIREWTLFLRYDDGTGWSTDFSTIGSDPTDLSSILLRTTSLPKL